MAQIDGGNKSDNNRNSICSLKSGHFNSLTIRNVY